MNPDEIIGNVYLHKITPCYKYYRLLNKICYKKRLCADVYIMNQEDELVATAISSNGYPLRIVPFTYSNSIGNPKLKQYDNRYKCLTEYLLTKEYDLMFYIGVSRYIIWCIKGTETHIYDIWEQKMFSLERYYECCWKYYSIEDILGIPIEKEGMKDEQFENR